MQTGESCPMLAVGRSRQGRVNLYALPPCERADERVFGMGNPAADLMFVGEGPGEQEDLQGLPSSGAPGSSWTGWYWKRWAHKQDFYIANTVKCARRQP